MNLLRIVLVIVILLYILVNRLDGYTTDEQVIGMDE